MNVAMIFAPLFAGYMYDTTNSYIVPFTIFAALCYFGAVLDAVRAKAEGAANRAGGGEGGGWALKAGGGGEGGS